MLKKVESEHLPVARHLSGPRPLKVGQWHPADTPTLTARWNVDVWGCVNHEISNQWYKFHLWGICQRNVHFPNILVIKMGCELPKPVIHHPGVFHFQLGHPERTTFISYCYFEGQFAQLQTLTKRWRCFRPANSPLFKNWRKLPTLQNVRLLSPGSTNKSIGKLPALWMISFKTNLRCELMTPWDPWKVGKAF